MHKIKRNEAAFKYINKELFPSDDKSCISTIKDLRNKLVHNNGEFNSEEIDKDIAHSVLMLHYILLPISKKMILNTEDNRWIIDKIPKFHGWDEISIVLSRLLSSKKYSEIVPHKDNYYEIPEYSFCEECGTYNTTKLLETEEKHKYNMICWLCLDLKNYVMRYCCRCGIYLPEENFHILNDDDPSHVMCKYCYEFISSNP